MAETTLVHGLPITTMNEHQHRRIRALLDTYDGDRMMVGEVFLYDVPRVARYVEGESTVVVYYTDPRRDPVETRLPPDTNIIEVLDSSGIAPEQVPIDVEPASRWGAVLGGIAIFLPYAIPAVVATLMWGFMYGTRFGLVGDLNEALGLSLPDPLSADLVLASIGAIAVNGTSAWLLAGVRHHGGRMTRPTVARCTSAGASRWVPMCSPVRMLWCFQNGPGSL